MDGVKVGGIMGGAPCGVGGGVEAASVAIRGEVVEVGKMTGSS